LTDAASISSRQAPGGGDHGHMATRARDGSTTRAAPASTPCGRLAQHP